MELRRFFQVRMCLVHCMFLYFFLECRFIALLMSNGILVTRHICVYACMCVSVAGGVCMRAYGVPKIKVCVYVCVSLFGGITASQLIFKIKIRANFYFVL